MKKLIVLLAMVLVFGIVGIANASLSVIGSASYDSDGNGTPETYNLIYEDDSIDGGLVWLDYTRSGDRCENQVNWASGIGGSLTVNLDPGYTTDIDWSTGWRLPLTQDETAGYNQTGSEMGHLYYDSLGNVAYDEPGWGLNNVGDFNTLQSLDYWSGTGYSFTAWFFSFYNGNQLTDYKDLTYYALAVRPGQVSAVPLPGAVWLLGSGLIGIAGFRRKSKKA